MDCSAMILIFRTALKPTLLAKSQAAKATLESILKQAITAFVLYSICTVLAFGFPLIIFIIITLTWIVWLILGINYKEKN